MEEFEQLQNELNQKAQTKKKMLVQPFYKKVERKIIYKEELLSSKAP